MGLSFSFLHFVLWLSLFHLALAHFASSKQSLCHDDERSALLQFKESLIIDNSASEDPSAYSKIASWKAEEEDGDCCLWDGITCHGVTGHVIKLNLTSSYLYGSINSGSSLFHLAHLEWLSLADNHFNGSKIPSGIRNLSRLSHLDLSDSVFSGQIPQEILNLSKLETLDVSFNPNLELQKPGLRSLVEKLTNLKNLSLSQVNISASVPHILANLSSLTYLSLRGCQLQGEFPIQILQLPNLSLLSVRDNPDLTVYLPEFETSNPLEDLDLASTRFSGEIPDSIGNLKSLSYLDISDCNFSGTIPYSLGNLTKLVSLSLSSNHFSGELPTSFGNLRSLEELGLADNNFSGNDFNSFSVIANLTKLTDLDLCYLNLLGEIPSWIMNLTHVSELAMAVNQLTGPIPGWLMNLNQLTGLYLQYNYLTGHIPCAIGNLTRLTRLHLGSNELEGAILPCSINNLKNLRWLDLSSNNLSGTLDLHVFLLELKSLEVLVFSWNNLSLLTRNIVHINLQQFDVIGFSSCNLTEFPNFLRSQDYMRVLDLSSNKLAGHIPGWFLKVSIHHLLYLNLSRNLLTGFDQHPSIFPWSRLKTLDLSFNKLQGPLPLPSIFIYSYLVQNNHLVGKIPSSICSLNQIFALDLANNNLNGMLPRCLGNFSDQLSILKLQANNFSGTIPQSFTSGTKLMMLDLSHNLLRGKIPRSLANCAMLEYLVLGNNQINDVFPSWLGTLPELKVLILKVNKLHGVIQEPKTDFDFPKLHIIDLSHNRFTGNFPSKYFQSWNAMKIVNTSDKLAYMKIELMPPAYPVSTYYGAYDYSITLSCKGIEMQYVKLSNLVKGLILSSNKFEGEIPSSIGDLMVLHCLNISNNNLQGQIPLSLGNLRELESLDLSNNRLSGQIPQQLAELTSLEVFDVSHNHLTGPIPQGKQFDTFENSSFDGNPGLCGKPLSKICENSKPPKEEDQGSSSPFAFGWKIAVIGYASGQMIGCALGHTLTTRKSQWFAKTFGLQLKIIERQRRRRNIMQFIFSSKWYSM